MKFLLFLSLTLSVVSSHAELNCGDVLVRPKSYFSLLFSAAGGAFVTPFEIEHSENRVEIQDPVDTVERVNPNDYGRPELKPMIARMRFVFDQGIWDAYLRYGRWDAFVEEVLKNEHRSFVFSDKLWATILIGAGNGNMTQAVQWVQKLLSERVAELDSLLTPEDHSDLVRAIREPIQTSVIADDFFSERLYRMAQEGEYSLSRHRLVNWSFLAANLSSAEIFLVQQVLSWSVVRSAPRDPQNLKSAIDSLFVDLINGNVRPEILDRVEFHLIANMATNQDDPLDLGSLFPWRVAVHWLRNNGPDGTNLVRDTLEFRRFFPEVR